MTDSPVLADVGKVPLELPDLARRALANAIFSHGTDQGRAIMAGLEAAARYCLDAYQETERQYAASDLAIVAFRTEGGDLETQYGHGAIAYAEVRRGGRYLAGFGLLPDGTAELWCD